MALSEYGRGGRGRRSRTAQEPLREPPGRDREYLNGCIPTGRQPLPFPVLPAAFRGKVAPGRKTLKLPLNHCPPST